ncbi:MAG: hypothetical protein RJA41_613 [Actinomycetota bacterium]
MKFLASKFALPMASAIAVIALIGVQAAALSQSPNDEVSTVADLKPASVESDESTSAQPSEPEPSTTPLVIPTDGPTTLPLDDDEYEDEDEDEDEYEDDEDEYEDN